MHAAVRLERNHLTVMFLKDYLNLFLEDKAKWAQGTILEDRAKWAQGIILFTREILAMDICNNPYELLIKYTVASV